MTEYTIDDIRGPTVAREMAQLKEFVLAQFNGAIADAEAAAAAAATAAENAVLANTVKKTGEASQSIAGDIAITGSLDAASIGSGSTPVVCGNLTAYGSVSLDDTTLQGNLSGAGSVLVPAPTSNSEAATKKYVDDADALKLNITDVNTYAVGLTGNQNIGGLKSFGNYVDLTAGTTEVRIFESASKKSNIASFGVRYRTATATHASIKSYAPKVDPDDSSEVARGGFLQLVANQNGTMTLNVYGTKADGTTVAKTLATFDGTTWS